MTKADEGQQDKLVVHSDVSQEVRDRIKSFTDDDTMPDHVEVVDNPDAADPPEGNTFNFDAKDGGADSKAKTKSSESKGDEPSSGSDDEPGDDAPAKGDENADSQDEPKIKVTLHGVERELSMHEVKSAVGRQSSLQKQLNELTKSDEMKFGTLLKAAQDGDKKAAKKVQNLLVKGLEKDDADQLNDELDDVKGEFDEDEVLAKKQLEARFDTIFGAVKNDVDFQKNMDTIQGDLKTAMPEKVWTHYWEVPEHRKVLYDLAASGRQSELLGALNEHLAKLPFEKQLEVQSNPDLFGEAFLIVTREQNAVARKNAEANDEGSDEQDELSAVSPGPTARSKDTTPAHGEGPDFENMSSEEFMKQRSKMGFNF